MGIESLDCCRHLPWDSAHFGLRIARVNSSRLTPALVSEVDQWGRRHSIECLYLLADPDPETMRLAAGSGFRFVDTRTTLERGLPEIAGPAELTLRMATAGDVADLCRIAQESHHDSRFYADGNFQPAACDAMYRIWIERSCLEPGFVDAVFVAEHQARAAGYISCRLTAGRGSIELVGVDGRCRGLGIGERLVRRACSWFREQDRQTVSVVTQGANIPALRLYLKCSFLISQVQLWYHRWSA